MKERGKSYYLVIFFHVMVKDESKNDVHDINVGTLVAEAIDDETFQRFMQIS